MQRQLPLSEIVCSGASDVIDIMRQIEKNGKGILFVCDDKGIFLGTVTDGDVRRGVLSRKNLDFKASELANPSALTAQWTETPENIEQKIKAFRPIKDVRIVPILREGICIDYYELESRFFVPISAPALMGNELNYVHDCVSSGWISSQGSYVTRFEKMFAEKYRVAHAVSVMNATCGLQLALKALGIGSGDEVIVPSLTFAATINAVLQCGATPLIVDSLEDWCINPKSIELVITEKTKAIIPVHIYGQVCEMDVILSIAKKHKLWVVEDCAEAQGASYKGRAVGSLGDVGCFSFFANKIMTTGEGGMNTTNNPQLNEKMRRLRDHGKNPSVLGYYHDEVGFNFRLTNIQAAIGVAQMEKIDSLISDRARIKAYYAEKLNGISELTPQTAFQQKDVSPVCWLVSYILSPKIDREKFLIQLKEKGIDVRPFFLPMHKMKLYNEYLAEPCPFSEKIGATGLNFPTSTYMTSEVIDFVVTQIKETLDALRN